MNIESNATDNRDTNVELESREVVFHNVGESVHEATFDHDDFTIINTPISFSKAGFSERDARRGDFGTSADRYMCVMSHISRVFMSKR